MKRLFFCMALLGASGQIFAEERFKRDFFEVGFERYWATVPYEKAVFTGLTARYYPMPNFFLGTNQTSLTWKSTSEYRPDFHLGVIFPFTENVGLEATLGVDFFTALIIALAILDEDDSINYKFATSFYSPYFTLSTNLRFDFDRFAVRLLSQFQFGGYYLSETSNFNVSIWLGLGTTVRFDLN